MQSFFIRTTNTQIRLRGCSHVRRCVFHVAAQMYSIRKGECFQYSKILLAGSNLIRLIGCTGWSGFSLCTFEPEGEESQVLIYALNEDKSACASANSDEASLSA